MTRVSWNRDSFSQTKDSMADGYATLRDALERGIKRARSNGNNKLANTLQEELMVVYGVYERTLNAVVSQRGEQW